MFPSWAGCDWDKRPGTAYGELAKRSKAEGGRVWDVNGSLWANDKQFVICGTPVAATVVQTTIQVLLCSIYVSGVEEAQKTTPSGPCAT